MGTGRPFKHENGDAYWYNDSGELHRDGDLPTIIYASKSMEWFQHFLLHRDNDRPAVIKGCNYSAWWRFGRLHRIGGPAIIENGKSSYWLCNKEYTKLKYKWMMFLGFIHWSDYEVEVSNGENVYITSLESQ